jgi:hypothetical protein
MRILPSLVGAVAALLCSATSLAVVPPPEIDVAPTSLSSTLPPDSVETQTLTVANTGASDLELSIIEDDSACDSPADLPWLSVSPNLATIPPGGAVSVDVTSDSTGLGAGAYAGYLCVNSNDPVTPVVVVPVSLTVELAIIEVAVDIRPGSCPNPLNCKSKGVLPVAILGTADFDVTTIDPVTVRLAGAAPLRWDYEDVATAYEPFTGKQDCNMDCNEMGPDGYMDATLKFKTQEVVEALGEAVQDGACIVAQLTGNLREGAGGTEIVGEDVIRISCKGKKN